MSGDSELRPAYRTLDEPTRLFGISLAGWGVLLAAAAAGYGWLMVSPLPWRANLSLVVIVLGAPATLVVLREQSTISPGRVLAAVAVWRARSALIVAPDEQRPVARGGVRRDTPAPDLGDEHPDAVELPWIAEPTAPDGGDASQNGAARTGAGS